MGYYLVNEETGELVLGEEYLTYQKAKIDISKKIVDKMLSECSSPKDINLKMLFGWCKITKEINDYNQIKIKGSYFDEVVKTSMLKDVTITGYAMRVFDKAHNFSAVIMKNKHTPVQSWSELFLEIECKNRLTQKKVKTFLVENKLVRDIKIVNRKGEKVQQFIVNPFLVRGANYSSQIAIILFQDFIKEGVNMSVYSVRLLQRLGHVGDTNENKK